MRYKTIEELIDKIDRPIKTKIHDVYIKYEAEFTSAKGSQYNHQAWTGGLLDHIVDTMNIACLLYHGMISKRPLPFSISDALIVIFLHDIEKAFPDKITELMNISIYFTRSKAKSKLRYNILHAENIWVLLKEPHMNALDFAEGEGESYTNDHRAMGPLAAFVHLCDTTSARIWFDHPLIERETWGWREGSRCQEEQLWGV